MENSQKMASIPADIAEHIIIGDGRGEIEWEDEFYILVDVKDGKARMLNSEPNEDCSSVGDTVIAFYEDGRIDFLTCYEGELVTVPYDAIKDQI